jgi:hypothetical protein
MVNLSSIEQTTPSGREPAHYPTGTTDAPPKIWKRRTTQKSEILDWTGFLTPCNLELQQSCVMGNSSLAPYRAPYVPFPN